MKYWVAFASALLVLTAAPQARGAGLAPAAGELQVNTYTLYEQNDPSVAVASDGRYAIVWTDDSDLDGDGAGVFGQLFDSDGTPAGSQFQVNGATIGFQAGGDVAFTPNGDFVAVWMSNNDVRGQRFSSSGATIGTEFPVNIPAPGFQGAPGIVAGTSGGFVVVWSDVSGRDGDYFGIFGKRFNSSANPVSGEFQVNTYTVGTQAFQRRGAIAADANGAFVVAWQSTGQDGYLDGVFAQRFTNLGAKNGAEFQANTHTISWQRSTAAAAAPNGDFVIAWIGYNQDGDWTGIFSRRFASSGAPLTGEIQINTYTENAQGNPGIDVAAAGNGDFVVTWESQYQDASEFGVFAKFVSKSGVALTPELQVNTYTFGDQRLPAIGASPDGNFVVAWQSYGQDGYDYGIFAQRLAPDGECTLTPVSGCRTAGKSLLLMKQPNSGKDKLIWKFLKGDATTLDELGDPTDDTDYALCIYVGSTNALLAQVSAPADAGKWQPMGTKGYKYNDPGKTPDGVQKVLVSSGAQGKSKAKVKGKDANLPDPVLGALETPITVQLKRSGSLTCWEATYQSGDIIDNDADTLKAKFTN